MMISSYSLRPAMNEDADQLIAMIDSCFQEYEDQGVFIDLDNLDADLTSIRSYTESQQGEFWLLFDKDKLIASVGVAPVDKFSKKKICELKRLYMLADYRGQGIAEGLLSLVENWARDYGAIALTLWTDTRFSRAHNFYKKHGFVQQAETRDLNDLSNTTEYEFQKDLML